MVIFRCREEAHMQYLRDRRVEANIVHLLKRRWLDCLYYENPHQVKEIVFNFV